MRNLSKYTLIGDISAYPSVPPFNPSQQYPEYPFKSIETKEINKVYASVRQALYELNLDLEHYGTPEWNPLGDIVKPGSKIAIKPNFVRDFHETNGNIFSVITHGSVIRAIADYALIALKGKGSLIIADAPQCDAGPFENLLSLTGLDKVQEFYSQNGLKIKCYDLRVERVKQKEKGGVILERIPLIGDPMGYVKVDLGSESFLSEIEDFSKLLCGSDYDFEETRSHHKNGHHEYLISKTILNSDLVISIPKLKTHKRTGVTLNLKNMIGANGNKNYIPHYRTGSANKGGDEFPYEGLTREIEGGIKSWLLPKLFLSKGVILQFARFIRKIHKGMVAYTGFAKIRSGAWYGNDTLWRAIFDINRIILFADAEGKIYKDYQRKYLSLIDGVIAGEGEGPLNSKEKKSGFIIAGFNPFIVDAVGAYLMGFNVEELPELSEFFKKKLEFEDFLDNIKIRVPNLKFERWQGWERT